MPNNHWLYIIIKLKSKYINYKNEYCFDGIPTYGSKSKKLAGIKILKETICVYEFDYPDYKIYNGNIELEQYGSSLDELKKQDEISYPGIYGGDYAELIFKNLDNNNDKKLLVYSNSYSNAINKLLAANYQETYIIDGRYYKESNMIDYINKHEIDDVLILANSMLLWDDIRW